MAAWRSKWQIFWISESVTLCNRMNWLSTKRISSSNKQQQRRCREPKAVSAAQRVQREPQNRGSSAAMEALVVVSMLNCNIDRQ